MERKIENGKERRKSRPVCKKKRGRELGGKGNETLNRVNRGRQSRANKPQKERSRGKPQENAREGERRIGRNEQQTARSKTRSEKRKKGSLRGRPGCYREVQRRKQDTFL